MKTHHILTALSDKNNFKSGDVWRFPSPAKLNLFLYINNKRADGYHELQTLFQFLDYGDWLEISLRDDGEIYLTPEIPHLKPEDNLIYRAAKALQQKTGCTQGANIHLDKILPIGGGIGGGSSNAATTLIALNYLWKTHLSLNELAQLGVKLGADVPIFIHGKAAIAEGVGEIFYNCTPTEKWYVVLKPETSISTAVVFSHPDLPRNTPKRSIDQLLTDEFANDCEKVVRNCYPMVEETLGWLLKYAPSRLTGTGACIFAEFNDEQSARVVFEKKPEQFTGFIAKGCNRSPLHQWLETFS